MVLIISAVPNWSLANGTPCNVGKIECQTQNRVEQKITSRCVLGACLEQLKWE